MYRASARAICRRLTNFCLLRHLCVARRFHPPLFVGLDAPDCPRAAQVYKAECALGYATAESEGGLYVDLANHVAFGREYVEAAFAKTGNPAYLRCGTRARTPAWPRRPAGAWGLRGRRRAARSPSGGGTPHSDPTRQQLMLF